MKIAFKNFRCYSNQTFEFDDDTITLISGPSGQGKTTILLGIQFALYGSLKHRYLIAHNKTSCEVVLEYKNFKIKRTKRPNILNVNHGDKSYEDKEAQIVLNKYFGVANSSVFFMDLSHLEKMEFLEKIINTNCDIKELKIQIKTELLSLSKEMAVIDGQILNMNSMLELIQKPDHVDCPLIDTFFGREDPLRDLSLEDLHLRREYILKQIEQERILKTKHNNLVVEVNVLQEEINSLGELDHTLPHKIDTLATALRDLKERRYYWAAMRDNFLMAEESLKEIKKYNHIDSNIMEELSRRIKTTEEHIAYGETLKLVDDYNRLKTNYDKDFQEEWENWHTQVETLKQKLSSISIDQELLSKLPELERICDNFKSATTFNMEHNIESIESQIQALKLKFFKCYNCLKCNHKLIINMDTLEMVENVADIENINNIRFDASIKNKLKKLELLKDKLEANADLIHQTNIQELKGQIELIKKHQEITNIIKQMDSFRPSISLRNLEKQVIKLKKRLPQNFDSFGPRQNLEVLKDEKRDLIINFNSISHQMKIKNDLLKKIKLGETYDQVEHESILNLIERYSDELNQKNVELEKLKTKERLQLKLELVKIDMGKIQYVDQTVYLDELLKKIEIGLEYHNKLTQYEIFRVQLKKYKKAKQTLNNFIISRKNMERTYLKMLLFKQKVVESEHESLQFMVNIINTHLSLLLQDFFSEGFGDPIQIYLELVSDKRPQVNIIINYKGNKVDYKSLSTGEYARVKLAFDLTFKEILGEQVIMLDECTANLDQDLSTKIFNRIKKTFPSKTILVVAHQVITGTFNNVLKL